MAQFSVVPTGDVDVVSVASIKATDLDSVKQYVNGARTDDDVLIDGKKVYRVPNIAVRQEGAVIDHVSLRVFNPTDVVALKPYKLVNPVFRSYVQDNRIAWSITADGLAEVK